MSVTSKPAFTPEIKELFSGAYKSIKERVTKLGAPADTKNFPTWAVALILLLAIGLFIYYFKVSKFFENPPNIHSLAKSAVQAQVAYGLSNPNRKGLREYVTALKASGVPDQQLCLTNFYISTANAGGFFFPGENGIASPEAARAAVLGGARAIVFDIWPDVSPDAQFGPCIQVVESGSLWRRISMNSMPFASVLKALIQEAFELDMRPGYYDPLILYLRFRGKPRQDTYNLTAAAFASILEPYRLDASYNSCRNQSEIFSRPITDFMRKVIVVSNTRANSSVLSEYINIGPADGIKMDWGVNDARGLSTDGVIEQKRKVQQNLTWVAPLSEDPHAEANDWKIGPSQDVGIHMCAMNFWNNNDNLKAYLAPDMFGIQSFKIKPVPLRYIIELLPVPKVPTNPGWGSGTTAGSPTIPREIQLP